MKYLILIMILFCSSVQADELIDLKLSASILIVMDGLTTRNLIKNNITETNPALGQSPSIKSVNVYFASCVAAVWMTKYIPKKYQKPTLYYINSLQRYHINVNLKTIGVGVSI